MGHLQNGILCTPAFAMTDHKSQGKQFSKVLVNLKGVYGSSTVTRPSFSRLYVQLSRAEWWEGLYHFRKSERGDFIGPKNMLDRGMREAVAKLERLGDETISVGAVNELAGLLANELQNEVGTDSLD